MGNQAGSFPRAVILASQDDHRVPVVLNRLAGVLKRARRRPLTPEVSPVAGGLNLQLFTAAGVGVVLKDVFVNSFVSYVHSQKFHLTCSRNYLSMQNPSTHGR